MASKKLILSVLAVCYLGLFGACTQKMNLTETSPLEVASSSSSTSPLPSPTSTPTPTVSLTNTATFTASPSPTVTQTPTPSLTPTPTNTPHPTRVPHSPEREVELILQKIRHESSIYGDTDIAVRGMDYLMRYPNTPHREQILTALFYLNSYFMRDWFPFLWLDEFVRQAFNEAQGIPPQFDGTDETWPIPDMLQIYETDLDGNGVADFVISVKHRFWSGIGDGRLLWLHGQPGDYQLWALSKSMYAEVRKMKDLNNDGQLELFYVVPTRGASNYFETAFILTWQDDNFKDMVIGPKQTQNGTWQVVDEDTNGLYELIQIRGGAGSAGFCCILSYQLTHELYQNEYIPISQIPYTWAAEGENPSWQLAKMKQHTYHYQEVLEYFQALLNRDNDYFQETIPYIWFQIGIAQVLLDEIEGANEAWQVLASDFPDHPLTLDVLEIQAFLQKKGGLWQACQWLRENKRAWPLPEKKRAILRTEATYNSWGDLCDPRFLFGQWPWMQSVPIVDQLKQRGLNWHSLSESFDLNGDDIIDPIGEITLFDYRQRWAFLSQADGTYLPFFVDNPYPVEAIYIWDKSGYDDFSLRQFEAELTDVNEDGKLELQYAYSDGEVFWISEWIGHRFKWPDSDIEIGEVGLPNFSDELSMSNIFLTLFYEQNFEKAIDLLAKYDPDLHSSLNNRQYWEEAGVYFLRGLTYSYLGEEDLAQAFFAKVIQEYADTTWVDLAQEKFDFEKE